MPLLEYLCDYCGHKFEEFKFIKENEHLCRCMSVATLLGVIGEGHEKVNQYATATSRKRDKK